MKQNVAVEKSLSVSEIWMKEGVLFEGTTKLRNSLTNDKKSLL